MGGPPCWTDTVRGVLTISQSEGMPRAVPVTDGQIDEISHVVDDHQATGLPCRCNQICQGLVSAQGLRRHQVPWTTMCDDAVQTITTWAFQGEGQETATGVGPDPDGPDGDAAHPVQLRVNDGGGMMDLSSSTHRGAGQHQSLGGGISCGQGLQEIHQPSLSQVLGPVNEQPTSLDQTLAVQGGEGQVGPYAAGSHWAPVEEVVVPGAQKKATIIVITLSPPPIASLGRRGIQEEDGTTSGKDGHTAALQGPSVLTAPTSNSRSPLRILLGTSQKHPLPKTEQADTQLHHTVDVGFLQIPSRMYRLSMAGVMECHGHGDGMPCLRQGRSRSRLVRGAGCLLRWAGFPPEEGLHLCQLCTVVGQHALIHPGEVGWCVGKVTPPITGCPFRRGWAPLGQRGAGPWWTVGDCIAWVPLPDTVSLPGPRGPIGPQAAESAGSRRIAASWHPPICLGNSPEDIEAGMACPGQSRRWHAAGCRSPPATNA